VLKSCWIGWPRCWRVFWYYRPFQGCPRRAKSKLIGNLLQNGRGASRTDETSCGSLRMPRALEALRAYGDSGCDYRHGLGYYSDATKWSKVAQVRTNAFERSSLLAWLNEDPFFANFQWKTPLFTVTQMSKSIQPRIIELPSLRLETNVWSIHILKMLHLSNYWTHRATAPLLP
jgi:hypothetical protein